MNATRTTALAALAVLALGMGACAPDASTDPVEPTSTPTETAVAPEPAPTDTATTEAPESTEAESPAPEPTTSEPAEPTSAPPSDGVPAMDPAEGDLPGAAACHVDGGNRTAASTDAPTEGALRAWLCGDAPGGYNNVGPMEPLAGDVDAILTDFSALPEPGDPPAEVGDVYRVVFEYEDGSFAVLEGDAQPDGLVRAGDQERAGGEQFLNQVRGRWLDQRLAVGDPAEPAVDHAMACPSPEHYLVAHPVEDTSGGWICAGNSEEITALEMDPELAGQIAAELRENSTQSEGNLPATGTTLSLMVPWGEATVLKMLDNEPGFLWISDQGAMTYTPSPDVDAAIGDAVRHD